MKRVPSGVLSIVAIMVCMAWGSSLSHAAFVHPGILNTQAEYNLMKSKVLAGAQPWKAAYDSIPTYLSHTPQAVSSIRMDYEVDCNNASGMLKDALAAYGSALRWIVSGNSSHANKAKQILNAWAAANTSFTGNSQINLCISWYTPRFAYAAEILKHVPGSGWSSGDQTTFRNWVTSRIVPRLVDASATGNNWHTLGQGAKLAWGVWLDNQTLFNEGVSGYKLLVTNYISKFGLNVLDGYTRETCRGGGDLTHTAMGLAGLALAAEIGKKQGLNLYGFVGADDGFGLRTALLAHGQWWDYPNRSGSTNANWPCSLAFPGNTFEEGAFPNFSWHAMYNRYRDALLLNLSNYQGNVVTTRDRRVQIPWDRLTHNYGSAGSSPAPSMAISAPANVRVVSSQ
jgi:Alginate lyase